MQVQDCLAVLIPGLWEQRPSAVDIQSALGHNLADKTVADQEGHSLAALESDTQLALEVGIQPTLAVDIRAEPHNLEEHIRAELDIQAELDMRAERDTRAAPEEHGLDMPVAADILVDRDIAVELRKAEA